MPALEFFIPDIGDFKDVPVIDVLFKPGDWIKAGDALVTLESDKATVDVPAERSGRILAIQVTRGTRVSRGSPLLTLECEGASAAAELPQATRPPVSVVPEPVTPVQPGTTGELLPPSGTVSPVIHGLPGKEARLHASPSVRRMAREFDVELAGVKGSGPRGRIVKSDVHDFVRAAVKAGAIEPAQSAVAATFRAVVDFARFGEIERRSLSRIQRIAGQVLARNWSEIPHVTNFEDADITDLDSFRREIAGEAQAGPKITLVSFLVKACAVALRSFPTINASLDGSEIILKKYVHVGVAVDTPEGLVVPVVRNADQLGVREIAGVIDSRARQARDGTLARADLEGGCFTVSSLGGIGSTGFTPIINAPEVAILGVSRAAVQPRWDGAQFIPRQILPLALSWDHRALDGVIAAKFLVHLSKLLRDFRRITL